MALLPSELDQIRYELGWNLLTVGATPYIGIAAIFDRVVQPYLSGGLVTSSSTAVTAGSTGPVTLTLAAVNGTDPQGNPVSIHVGDRVVIDVEYNQESAVVQAVDINAQITLPLRLAHSQTYPVTVVGGEALVRYMLRRCWSVREMIANSDNAEGIKKVEEVEFFESKTGGGSATFEGLLKRQRYWRSELSRVLFGTGDPMVALNGGGDGGSRIGVY